MHSCLLSFSQILNLIYWTVLIFIVIVFKWRETENQQFLSSLVCLCSICGPCFVGNIQKESLFMSLLHHRFDISHKVHKRIKMPKI